jgi:molybdopterin-binding protein|uniref:TOBE domain-containing protein n=1 Tax=Nocardioides pini TaxID=2975053 RepID=UPI0038994BAE
MEPKRTQVRHTPTVITYRIAEAAEILAVSDDTVRRWVDAGRLPSRRDEGRTTVAGHDLADLAEHLAESGELAERDRTRAGTVSARNRMSGIVTRVKRDHVMAQVEMICGPYRVVSLMSTDAADELGLEPGVRAIASVKSTNVVVEVPK